LKTPPAKHESVGLGQTAKKKELLKYFGQWDDKHHLLLLPGAEVGPTQTGELFPLFKSEDQQRVVFNRIPGNMHEVALKGAEQDIVAAAALVDFEVPVGHFAFLFSEDLEDMYPSFLASEEMAATNVVGFKTDPEDFRGMKACDSLLKECK